MGTYSEFGTEQKSVEVEDEERRLEQLEFSDEKMVTVDQEVLLFQLLEDKHIYLLDKWRVVDKLKEGTLTCREAIGIISFLLGVIRVRRVLPDLEFVTVKLGIPLVDEK